MKNFRKLLFAGIMLVFALVAVVSSTVAWFTMQQEAQVSEIKLGAASEGLDLQISTDNVNWSYVVNVASPSGTAKLAPVTFDAKSDAMGFKKLAFDKETLDFNKFKYDTATKLEPSSSSGEGYLGIDLYFRSSNTDLDALYFNVTPTTGSLFKGATEEDVEILKTLRVMFLVSSGSGTEPVFSDHYSANTLIYEPNYDANNTYGKGAYFDPTNGYIAEGAFQHSQYKFFKTTKDENGHFQLDLGSEGWFNGRTYSASSDANATTLTTGAKGLKIASMSATTVLRVRVFIWLEGWDGDTNNTAALQNFTALLKFTADKEII